MPYIAEYVNRNLSLSHTVATTVLIVYTVGGQSSAYVMFSLMDVWPSNSTLLTWESNSKNSEFPLDLKCILT